MIDKWFKNDIDKILSKNNVVVFIDESKEATFLLDAVCNQYNIIRTGNDLEELYAKYQIEKCRNGEKNIVYTQVSKDKLTFIREYCETNGNVEIKYLQNYVKEKIFNNLKINLNLDKDELISAARISVGKTAEYWQDISNKGSNKMFDMEKELIPFLNNPIVYAKDLEAKKVKEIFFRKIYLLINQEYFDKPAETVAGEVAEYIFNAIVSNQLESPFKEIYFSWVDSTTYRPSFEKYLKKFRLPKNIQFQKVHASHPFVEIDKQQLTEIGKHLQNKTKVKEYLPFINQRASDRIATLQKISFWNDVKTLLEFDETEINNINSLNKAIEFYTTEFYKIDGAVRNLYDYFLNTPEILAPYQEYYNSKEIVFLDKWFRYFNQYKENQTGTLKRIMLENENKTAIVVGDGISYEISQNICNKLSAYSISNQYILSGLPSETEHNMSLLYTNGEIIKIHSQRNDYLMNELPNKNIGFIQLDDISEATDQFQYLICTYKDIDTLSEKLQQKALKYFAKIEDLCVKKIEQLLKNGYRKVYLVSDHGFVLSGLLSEANKIEVNIKGQHNKSERYIRTIEKQTISETDFIEIEQKYENYNYLYFSKTINPFKTVGAYGYSHGGISPQELITPFLCIENKNTGNQKLNIVFSNKADLENVTGDLFVLKLKSEKLPYIDLFKTERKVYFLFFANGKQLTKTEIFTIQHNTEISKEFSFEGYSELDIKLLDAQTHEQIDNAKAKRVNDRDLGGLL